MQRRTITLLILFAAVLGFIVGQRFPVHNYAILGERDVLLFDTRTGKVCDPLASTRTNKLPFPACHN